MVFLLAACNQSMPPSPPEITEANHTVVKKAEPEFTYTSPSMLIEAIRTIEGYEDSHNIPNHEKLGHDHSQTESWTTLESMKVVVGETEKYRDLNPQFEKIFSTCKRPDYGFHLLNTSLHIYHYPNNKHFEGVEKQAADLLKVAKDEERSASVLIFKDRLIVWEMDNSTVKVVPRE